MNNTTTTDLSRFGFREIKMLSEILNAWVESGLPDDFTNNEVAPMMNMSSGNVFLTNSEFEVAMMNGDKLESFYTSPYDGHEGFFEDLLSEYENMVSDDKEWFRNIGEVNGKTDELPVTYCADQFRYVINQDERGEFSASFYRINTETGEDENEAYQEIDTNDAATLGEEGIDYRDGESVMDYYNALNLDGAVEYSEILGVTDEANTEE